MKRAYEDNGSNPEPKRPSTGSGIGQDKTSVLRLLIPNSKVGSVIGKGGETLKQIREDADGARIRIIDALPGCEERVMVISCVNDPAAELSASQTAIINAQQHVMDAHPTGGSSTSEPRPEASHSARLLICHSQAGAVIGKAGAIIKQIRDDSRASVKVLGETELPPCALANDRVIAVTGPAEAVISALKLLTQQLRNNPSRERPGGPPPCLGGRMPGPYPGGGRPGGPPGPHGMMPPYPDAGRGQRRSY